MPHSSRKPRKPYHAKRVISQSEDGWSRIERTAPTRHGVSATIREELPPVDRSLTVQKLLEEHEKCKRQWVESDARQWLQQLLMRQMDKGGWALNKAVCVALGSLSLAWANRSRSVWQLVMFMDLVDMVRLNLNHTDELKVYAQEPRFTTLDKEFLESLHVGVLEAPQAEELVDEASLMFIPCLEWSLELPFMFVAAKSPLYLTSSMHWVAEEAERCRRRLVNDDPEGALRLLLKDCDDVFVASRAVLDTHDEHKTPEADFADGHSLSMSIYTLKQQDED